MTPGIWIALGALVLALAFGGYRAHTDGRFRGATRTEEKPTSEAPAAQTAAVPEAPRAWDAVATALPGERLGERATLVQFSTAFCAPCRVTKRVLSEVAEIVPGVRHVEVDAEHHLALTRELAILRTPTTLVLDETGREVSRAAGAPRKEQVMAALGRLVAD
ncbi:thioredoxin [Nocardioides sp. dk4132]|uniref:thioredoxin family protein n=1 Tax=unclassified Nocardioides TaxID=2615069 RepID=UPI001294BE57|nr:MULTISPECIES: thioredoxin family protein [unclassified Nocardioides]MQW78095.1 thioredoxin [Nocardioides sp. dk4132]QGA09078.1 thioredoxin [Nocardioides sp. dk884]